MIKFASRRVTGWSTRYLNQMAVYRALLARQARGYTLLADERQFVSEVHHLVGRYN